MNHSLARDEASDDTAPRPAHIYHIAYSSISLLSLYGLLTFSWLMPIMSGGAEAGSGNAVRQLIYVALLIAALVGARATVFPLRILSSIPMTMLVVLGFCWLTVAWSLDPGASIRRLILTTIMITGIFLAVERVGFSRAAQALIVTMTGFLAVSIATAIVLPNIGIHQLNDFDASDLAGSWKGILGHKNVAGPLASFVIIAMVFHPVRMPLLFRLAVTILAIAFLINTQSKTAMGMLAAALSIGWLFRFYSPRFRYTALLSFWGINLIVLLLFWANWETVLSMFSSKDSFTGRVQIWPAMLAYWHDHPMGAGYGAFWNISTANPILPYVSIRSYVSTISSGHNGYLDLLVSVGIVGLILSIIAFLLIPLSSILLAAQIPKRRLQFILAVLVFVAGQNFTETTLMDRDHPVHITWVMAISLLCIAREKSALGGRRLPAG